MKNRFSISPRLAIRTSWLVGSLGLAMLIAGSIYMLGDQQLLKAKVSWPIEEVRLGNSFRVEIDLDGLVIDESTITDFYLHLPDDLDASFLPSSLKVLNGSLEQATVLSYSGKKRLLIEGILVDSLRLEIMVQVSEDIAFAERSFPFAYGVKVNQEVLALQKESDQFNIQYIPLQLKHRLISAPNESQQWARYEVLIHNPPQGTNYDRENGLINLIATAPHPDAIIKSISLNGQSRPLSTENTNELSLKGLNLQAGASLLLHYELAFPAGIPESSLISIASVYVPGSVIKQTTPASIEPSPAKWSNLSLQDKGTSLQIEWQMLSESDHKGFKLEQSRDGIKFESLDFVPQQSSTSGANDYHYQFPINNNAYKYYRLGLESLNGQIQYSEIVSQHPLDDQAYSIAFAETEQSAQIQVAIPQQLRVEIRNQLGVTLAVVFEGMLEAGVPYRLDLSMSEFSEGDYLFWMEGEYFKSRRWFIRRRGKWRRFG
ncbi:MAG: hypothetical protein AB8H47_24140 [Bacteroidia bacterium]